MNKHFRKHHDPNLPLDRKGPAPSRTIAERRAYHRRYYRERKEAINRRKTKKSWARRGEAIAADAVDDVGVNEKLAQDTTTELFTLFEDLKQESWRFNQDVHSWPLVQSILYEVGVEVVD